MGRATSWNHFREPPDILLVRESDEPLYAQIVRQMRESIGSGRVGGGTRLPSTRVLARMLGVSRNTVLIAYELLAAEDLICSVGGSGAWVRMGAPVSLPPMEKLLAAAMYPEVVTLFEDCDGNPFYVRHPAR